MPKLTHPSSHQLTGPNSEAPTQKSRNPTAAVLGRVHCVRKRFVAFCSSRTHTGDGDHGRSWQGWSSASPCTPSHAPPALCTARGALGRRLSWQGRREQASTGSDLVRGQWCHWVAATPQSKPLATGGLPARCHGTSGKLLAERFMSSSTAAMKKKFLRSTHLGSLLTEAGSHNALHPASRHARLSTPSWWVLAARPGHHNF